METATAASAVSLRRSRLILASVARWTLAAVFAWSAGGKLFWPADFRALLLSSGLIPAELLTSVAYGLPIAELAVAVCLAVRPCLVAGLFGALLLSVLFVGTHTYLVYSGTVVPCGCAGVALTFASRPGHVALLVVSLAMTGASLYMLFTTGTGAPRPSNAD